MEDRINQTPVQQDVPARRKRGSWLRRFLLGFLLLLAVLVCVFFWLTYDTRSKPPYSTALELIRNDAQLIEHLGQPIRNVRWLPSGDYPTQFQIQVKGPKGMADISVTAGDFEGKWEITALDARVYAPDSPHDTARSFSLDIGISAEDAPTWPPGGAATEGEGGGDLGLEPPQGIDIGLPDGGPPSVEIDFPDMNIEMPSIPPTPES